MLYYIIKQKCTERNICLFLIKLLKASRYTIQCEIFNKKKKVDTRTGEMR